MTDTTQSKYRKRVKTEEDQPVIEENEVRIKGNFGNVKRYVDYAYRLLEGGPDSNMPTNAGDDQKANEDEHGSIPPPSKKFDTIMLKATGRAINKAVTTAEVVKRRVANLHQITTLETLAIVDVWEPLEAGLEEVETTRRVASITITLSRDEANIDKSDPGYQIPLQTSGIQPNFGNIDDRSYRNSGRGRNNYRGGRRRGGGNGNYYNNRGGGRRRPRGQYRGNRGGRGRGGGGGQGYNMNMKGGSPMGGGGGGGNGGRRSPRGRGQYRGNRGQQQYNQYNYGRQNQRGGGYQGGNQYRGQQQQNRGYNNGGGYGNRNYGGMGGMDDGGRGRMR